MHFAMHLNLMVFIPQVLSDAIQVKGLSSSPGNFFQVLDLEYPAIYIFSSFLRLILSKHCFWGTVLSGN